MNKRKMVGITPAHDDGNFRTFVNSGYINALLAQGILPVILPQTDDQALLKDMVEQLDGFIFSGGGDIDPAYFGEETHPKCGAPSPVRDRMELPLLRMLFARMDKPVLCICRGEQVMNVALGGALYQDLPSQVGGDIAHSQSESSDIPTHTVTIEPGTRLHSIIGEEAGMVNSLHHQAVKQPAEGLIVAARAADGVIEAIESPAHPFFMGVQWHPERMWAKHSPSARIFEAFAKAVTLQDNTQ